MEQKKNYKKPEFEEVEMNAKVTLLAGSCNTGGGGSDQCAFG